MADMTMIKKYLAMSDISLGTDALAQKFGTLLDLLKEWNEKFNLTSITQDREVVIKHFMDSLVLVPLNNSRSWQTIIDIGTGAGFPGVPLAIVFPEKEIFLSEANGKKIIFLKQAKESLGLKNITILHGRSEDLSRDKKLREIFDMAVMRALAAFPVALELSSGLVKTGGEIMYYASAKQASEVNKDLKCFKELGCALAGINEYVLPEDMGNHAIISVNKLWKTPFKYPRSYGVMKKKPL
jgi:16S rRNA (guanine527-N7)-methyltransferase